MIRICSGCGKHLGETYDDEEKIQGALIVYAYSKSKLGFGMGSM